MRFFAGDNCVATLTLGGAGAHASYYHKANDQVPTSVEVYCVFVFPLFHAKDHTFLSFVVADRCRI